MMFSFGYLAFVYYQYLYRHTRFLQKYIWDRLNVPLKIRIFMWFLHRKVLLTKDNLAKRQWNGSTKCVFYGLQESAEHLFVTCSFAKSVWRLLHFTFGLTPLTSVTNLFGTWLNGFDKVSKVSH